MIHHINFYSTQENIEGPYYQWESSSQVAFTTRAEAVAYAHAVCDSRGFDAFSFEEN